MKKLLLMLALVVSGAVNAQGGIDCPVAQPLCGSLGTPFLNTAEGLPANPNANYGCLATQPNPYWFYIPVSSPGDLHFLISQQSLSEVPIDVDFIVYGPYDSLDEACNNLDSAHIVDCSYSASATEYPDIENAQTGDLYIMLVTNYNGSPGHISIDIQDTTTAAIDCSGLGLNAFLDTNNNGVKDAGEIDFFMGNFNVEINNDGIVHNITTPSGNYFIYDPEMANTYDAGFEVLAEYADYFTVTTAGYENLTAPAGEVAMYTFAVSLTQSFTDLAAYIVPLEQPRPGFEHDVELVYANLSPLPVAAATLTFTADAPLTITNVDETVSNLTDNSFTVDITDLAPFEVVYFTVTMYLPNTVEIDDIVTSTATIAFDGADAFPDNNTSVNNDVVVGSFDPNDKMESRGRNVVLADFGSEDYLYYTIRFQNMGTASAINVRIEDMLNSQLDASTLQMIRSSHDFAMEQDGSSLTWTFDNIMLPAAQDNEPASHGYVYFRVKPVPGFEIGDIIPNGAGIYFDFNDVVETNVFETHFVAEQLSTTGFNTDDISIYPNPANGSVTMSFGNQEIENVTIFDITGKRVGYYSKPATNLTANISGYSPGIYVIEITAATGAKQVQKLLVK